MTAPHDQARRASSFGAVAEDYDRFRPGPPVEALAWLLPYGCRDVVDIGAGTGALTRLLVGAAPRVVAAEPDSRMAAVLAHRVPGAGVVTARAEELPLRDRSCDAVVGSSMWHWVDEERAPLEAARVLRPGGVLGILWSGWDRSDPALAELLAGSGLAARPADADPHRHRRQVRLPAGAPFSEVETHLLQWTLTVTASDLVGLAGTYSGFSVLPETEKARVRRELTDAVGRHLANTGASEMELPMRCLCRRAVRGD